MFAIYLDMMAQNSEICTRTERHNTNWAAGS